MNFRPTPLRIALLTYSTKLRGSVVHTLELATALTKIGHEVCVYALDKEGKGFERSLPCAVELIPASPAPVAMDALIHQRIQEFVVGLTATAKTHDIYHAQDCIAANALLQLRHQSKIPHVIRTVHHIEDFTNPYLHTCQERSIYEPDLCLCVSDRWQQALLMEYGITARRVLNGVNLARFSPVPSGQEPDLIQRFGLTGSPRYLTIGGIEPRKNSMRLLEAFAHVCQTHPHAQLIIAGGASIFDYQAYRDAFFYQAKQLGLEVGRSLILTGVLADHELPALYRLADVFCFPSLKEGWGLVVLEAIASGLPVITANQAPFTEFLTSEQAQLVDPESVNAIAQAMQASLDPRYTQPLLQNSRAILAQYSWQHSAQLHLHHYQTLLKTYA